MITVHNKKYANILSVNASAKTVTKSLFQGITRHYISSSPVFPAVWGLPGSVYLHDTVLSLGVVDDLWYLPVLHWCTIVISRWAKKQKRHLGPCCQFLCHFLQPFRAIMGVWALSCEIKKINTSLILIRGITDNINLCNLGSIWNTAGSD